MRKLVAIALFATIVVLAQGPAEAITMFEAILTTDQEVGSVPPQFPLSGGMGIFILNDAKTELSYDVTLFGLDLDGLQTPGNALDNVTRVHFHRAPANSNGPIVFGIIDSNAALRNDNNPNNLVIDAMNGRITGVWNLNEGNPGLPTTLASELSNLLAGRLYFNVHTSDFPGGEVRGQVNVVPEPATLLLMATGFVGLLGMTVLRRRP